MTALLKIDDLSVDFAVGDRWLRVLHGIDLTLARAEILGLVGESGCGKSVTAMAITQLLPRRASRIARGRVEFDGKNLLDLPRRELRGYRGARLSMIFQDPMTALDPVFTIGQQIGAVLRRHRRYTSKQARARSLALLHRVGLPDTVQHLDNYPHRLSGGMRQRAMIAMALACEPDVLIADEPTTALDVTTQAGILALLEELRRELGMAILLISHNLSVVAQICDRALVMYGGRIVEGASVAQLFDAPRHPYTQGLLRSIPQISTAPPSRLQAIPGHVPDLAHWPHGCPFCNRCSVATAVCSKETPRLYSHSHDHLVACHHA